MVIKKYQQAYRSKKKDAKRRSVPFNISLEEFTEVWKDSGHFDQLGNRKGQYVMARVINYDNIFKRHDSYYDGSILPYDIKTVRILSVEENHQAQKGRKAGPYSIERRLNMSAACTGRSWSKARRAAYERRYNHGS